MDQQITLLFEEFADSDLISITVSNSSDRDRIKKIRIRPVLIKKKLYFQISEFIGNKVYHTNVDRQGLIEALPDWFEGLFRQAEIESEKGRATLLISKRGKVTVIKKLNKPDESKASNKAGKLGASASDTAAIKVAADAFDMGKIARLSHNRSKNYILQEGVALPFLVDLGVMSEAGHIVKAKSDKFRQINRFLEYIEDVLPYLDKDKELTILDFGCGKSYLTFALYYYLKEQKGYNIRVTGMDLKEDVIEECSRLSVKYGYDRLEFLAGDIADYKGAAPDMVITLHACDTATDYALFHAVSLNARVILSVPCCQHELNKQISNELLKPIFKYGIIKERMSALITDALRAELLEAVGYNVQLLEFIDMEHTPKNILIRAIKKMQNTAGKGAGTRRLRECMDFLGVSPCLYRLLKDYIENYTEK
ncbi:MAG: SAM-dependent methyltransferase [Clostridiales bacterium]|nr:SAM-dependent methyltransferase [Clostridiales bacterium]